MEKVVVIGGSSGMGQGIAKAALALGYEVVIASRSQKKLDAAASAIGPVQTGVVDTNQETDLIRFFKKIGPFDHLVVTAADFVVGSFLEMQTEKGKGFFDSKFWGQYLAAKCGAPHMRAGGSITLFSGIAGHRPFAHFSVGAAINTAIEGLTRALALELAPLRVNAVSPGTIETPVWNSLSEAEKRETFQKAAAALPVKRIGQPEDIAKAVLYLMGCGFATGSVVYVDGGGRLV